MTTTETHRALAESMSGSRRHRQLARWAALALVPLGLTGCEGATASDDPSLEDLPRLALVEEMRIGSVDDPEVGFSRIADVAVADDGRLFVLDAQDLQIRAYSPEGEPLYRIGRRGQGPGEFESSPRFGIRGDTLWAIEGFRTTRLSLFRLDGTILGTEVAQPVIVPVEAGQGSVLPWAMNDDGMFASFFGGISFSQDAPPSDIQGLPRVPRVIWNAEGEVVDTIGWDATPPPRMVPPPGSDVGMPDFVELAGERHMVPQPPSPLPIWAHRTDGVIVLEEPTPTGPDDATVTLTRLGVESDTVWHRALRHTPEPYTEEDLDSIAARGARGVGLPVFRVGATAEVPDNVDVIANRLRAAMDFPTYRRKSQSLWLADDGGVWLSLADPEPSRSLWILLDDEGMPRGELELEAGARPLWNSGDVVWVTEPDELDVPWLVRYRVEQAG